MIPDSWERWDRLVEVDPTYVTDLGALRELAERAARALDGSDAAISHLERVEGELSWALDRRRMADLDGGRGLLRAVRDELERLRRREPRDE